METPLTAFTWGQRVTIIAQQDKLYLNVRNSVRRGARSPFLFGMRSRLLESFRDRLFEQA